MSPNDASLKAYLEKQAQADHALADLLEDPKPDQGVVHTPREIVQQPFLWRQTAQLMQQHAGDLRTFLRDAGLYVEHDRPQIVFAGAGTSDYVGLSLADLLRVHFRTPSNNWPTTRLTASPGAFLMDGQRYLMVHVARSGNSPESKAVLEYALERHPQEARHLVITCNEDGALAHLAREHPDKVYLIVLHEAANDEGLAMTSSFSSMVVAGQALAHLDDMAFFSDLVERMAGSAEHLIQAHTDEVHALATDPELARAFFLGNNDLLGAATESALKLQELTVGQIMAKGEDTMAFRHGPISAVTEQTVVCFFLSEDPYTRRYELDVLRQYQKAFADIGTRVVALGGQTPDLEREDGVKRMAYDPHGQRPVPAFYQTNLAVLVGQLFGLFASDARGLNVDDPSAQKALYSRTVQGVKIYEPTEEAYAPSLSSET